jgi:hypothetical protein
MKNQECHCEIRRLADESFEAISFHSISERLLRFARNDTSMIALFIALLPFFSLKVHSYEPYLDRSPDRIWENQAFGLGEKMVFSLDYAFINAGQTVMGIDTVLELEGRQCYRVSSLVSSNKTFDVIYKVRDRVETYIDVLGLYSRRYHKRLQEGKYRTNELVEYHQEKGEAVLYKNNLYKKTSKIQPCAQDILSALYFVRTLEFNVGDTLSINLHDVDKSYPLKIKVNRRERVKVPAGSFDCLVVEPFLESEGMFRNKGRIEIWLTNDDKKIPVLMRTEIAIIGHIDARLIRYIANDQ